MNSQLGLKRPKSTMVFAVTPSTTKTQTEVNAAIKPGTRYRKLVWLAALAVVLSAGGFFRYQVASHSAEPTSPAQTPIRQVNATMAQRVAHGEITLPATVQAYQATDLFARVNGFLKAWHFDIGAPVKAGQVLAEIETPELDQELAQAIAFHKQGKAEHQQAIAELEEAKAEVSVAEATILKSQANVAFAVSQADRYQKLAQAQTIAREEYENAVRKRDADQAELEAAKADLARRRTNLSTRQSVIDSREAIVGNRKANVQRLRDLTGFQKIVAPFDGIVTRRSAEVGMLVSSGSNAGTRPLFSMAQTEVLRVQASVPQSSALGIKAGDSAIVSIPEKPGQTFPAQVTRTAGTLDPTSRSLLVEVELSNREGLIPPGVYAQVRFQSVTDQTTWMIPTKALLMRSNGPHVVIVTPDGAVRTQKVTLGKDFGAAVEVLVGLKGDEQLVVNPTNELRDGMPVAIATRAPQSQAQK